jgi:anti-sigma-K factor RskA
MGWRRQRIGPYSREKNFLGSGNNSGGTSVLEDVRGFSTAELAALADGSLAPERRAELEARIAESPELAAQLAEQRRALALVQDAGAAVAAPAGLRASIEAQRPRRRERAPRRFRVFVPAGAVAAAAVIALIAVIGPASSGEQFTAALAPTGVVTGASGNATLTKTTSGWRIEVDASGLPRLDNGRFYEAWLKNRADVLVPIGTFNEGTNVTLWAGVSPKDFRTLTITRERADGDQASSGQRVLVGTVDTGSG